VDLMVLDLSMPGMSGRAVLERVVREYPGLPVVVVSGDPGEALLPGARVVLQKPVPMEQLRAMLRDILPSAPPASHA
jgi:CheY-like chemotaxis protein